MLFFAVAEELISLVADSGRFDVLKVSCMRIKRKILNGIFELDRQ